MTPEMQLQLELALRLAVAALIGAAIGFEREIHGKPAGMRTHLLVSLGSAIFTVISIYGFVNTGVSGVGPVDPSRVAAQVVTGIGFLGAGAIIKEGTTIRGLTTAASLWAASALGLAIGAAAFPVGLFGAALTIFSLWPLHRVEVMLEERRTRQVRLHLSVTSLDGLSSIAAAVAEQGGIIVSVRTHPTDHGQLGRHDVELDLRLPDGVTMLPGIVTAVSALPTVETIETVLRHQA